MALLIMLNNFLHDFGAAAWLVGTLFLWRLLAVSADQRAKEPVPELLRMSLRIMRISFLLIVVMGTIRAIYYNEYEWNEAAGRAQVTLLAIKHILFLPLFIPGCIYYVKGNRILRANY